MMQHNFVFLAYLSAALICGGATFRLWWKQRYLNILQATLEPHDS